MPIADRLDGAHGPDPPNDFERVAALINDNHMTTSDHDAVPLYRGGIPRALCRLFANEANYASNIVRVYDISERHVLDI
ncbi:MAG: hypothetical protein ACRDHP_16170 [Ktedonobacterales bacterium]